jgi:cytochrome c553
VSACAVEGGTPSSTPSGYYHRTKAPIRGLLTAVLVVLTALPVVAAALDERLAPCLACHGEHGQSVTPEVPSLGAQPAFYVMVQLYMFRGKLRVVEPMNAVTQGLTDEELRGMAAAIAKLPAPRPVDEAADPARLERARAVIQQQRCNFCHTATFAGVENVPRLAGQREDYLVKALREYKNNTRRGYDPAMAEVLYAITDEQIGDLAYFLARSP